MLRGLRIFLLHGMVENKYELQIMIGGGESSDKFRTILTFFFCLFKGAE